jgi:hypothetical protein
MTEPDGHPTMPVQEAGNAQETSDLTMTPGGSREEVYSNRSTGDRLSVVGTFFFLDGNVEKDDARRNIRWRNPFSVEVVPWPCHYLP